MKLNMNLSIKTRVTTWIALMMILVAIVAVAFVMFVDRTGFIADSNERLESVVERNVAAFSNGSVTWQNVDFYEKGVFCSYYDSKGMLLRGVAIDGLEPDDIPLERNTKRLADVDGDDFYVYDTHLKTKGTSVWMRCLVPVNNDSVTARTAIRMVLMLIPFFLLISVGGGWLIAKGAVEPVEKITQTANSINDGSDLSRRIDLKHAAPEMLELSETFDSMFDRLETSFETEKQFTSDASHELRTPIAVIRASCDRSRRKDKTPEDYKETVDVVDEQAEKMSKLVEQLLSLTRIQYGVDRYPLSDGDLSMLVQEVCEEYVPEDRRGIELHTEIAEGIEAHFNPQLMASLVQNLLQNGYRYGKPGGNIWLKLAKSDAGKAVLTVRDDGIGMTPEQQEHIWQRFWQADASRSENQGSGLGLALVKEVTELHGGTIDLVSIPDIGSCFTVTI